MRRQSFISRISSVISEYSAIIFGVWLVVAGMSLGILGIDEQPAAITIILILSAGWVVAFYAFRYLQTSRKEISSYGSYMLSSLEREVEALRTEVASVNRDRLVLSDDDIVGIKSRIISEIKSNTVSLLAKEWESKFRSSADENLNVQSIRNISNFMQARLTGEIEALARRSNLNLIIGVFISLVGLAMLGWFVLEIANQLSVETRHLDIALVFGIRLSLVIWTTIFAYFFLRLYRYGIFEIKYFQNEITGAQFRLIALEAALKTNDKRTIERICSDMVHTERNFILKKGETTIGLTREAQEKKQDAALLAFAERLLRQADPKTD